MMSRPGADNPRVADPRRDPGNSEISEARPAAHHRRLSELELELAEAQEALARQRREFEEDSASFGQAIARLSHSERTLGQTKTKLLDAEDRAAKAEARIVALNAELEQVTSQAREQQGAFQYEADAAFARDLEQKQALERLRSECLAKSQELEAAHEGTARALAQGEALREMAESLSRDSAAGAAECAKLAESLKAAEEREHGARSRAEQAESDRAACLAEQSELRRHDAELTARSNELDAERERALANEASARTALAERDTQLAGAQRQIAEFDRERARFIGVLGALEALGQQMAEASFRARTEAEARSAAAHEDPDPERERITLKPEPAAPKNLPRSLRVSTAPEILIDGVRLES